MREVAKLWNADAIGKVFETLPVPNCSCQMQEKVFSHKMRHMCKSRRFKKASAHNLLCAKEAVWASKCSNTTQVNRF